MSHLKPHFEPRVKNVIWLFMHGGPSQVDLFDRVRSAECALFGCKSLGCVGI